MRHFDDIKFPYFSTQQLNLDWILTKIKELMGFMPEDGNVGDILTRKSDGAAWEAPTAVQVDINGLLEDTQIMDNDQLIFYDISAQGNRKIKPPNLLDSMCSDAFPLMNGIASAGTSKKPARYDHIHPTDTSRAPMSYFQNGNLKLGNGGTGANNASDARDNLGIPYVIKKETFTQTTTGGAQRYVSATDYPFLVAAVCETSTIGVDIYGIANNNWILFFHDMTGSGQANTSVTYTIYYLE